MIGLLSSISLSALAILTIGCNKTPQTSNSASQSSNLPSVKELVDAHIKASGGRAAIEGVTSRRETVRHSYSYDPSVWSESLEEIAAGRGAVWTWNNSDGTQCLSGFDGETAWLIKDGRPAIETGEDYERTAYFSHLSLILDWDELYRSAAVTGAESFHGVDCFAVEATTMGDLSICMYFEKDTGLASGIAYSFDRDGRRIHVERLLTDYRRVGDTLIAHKATAWYSDPTAQVNWQTSGISKKLEINIAFPEGYFDLPKKVRDLF